MSGDAPRGVIVAAPRSGSGKTTVTLGLLRALRRRGVSVQPFKCGPDYIDPAFHAAAAGLPSVNLDSWAMRPELIRRLACDFGSQADLCIVEGVMGLFDGAANQGQAGTGSTADLAALTGWPVILVLDISAQAETAAAVALGCQTYRKDIDLAGVILNSVAGPRHESMVRHALAGIGIPVLAAVARNREMSLPERHLGLVQAGETAEIDRRLDEIADAVEAANPLDAIVAFARTLKPADASHSEKTAAPVAPPGQRVALAQDHAFSFLYPHLLAGWRESGAQILPFSPLGDEAPAADCDCVWLPGGYPELHGGTLAAANNFKTGMRAAAERGIPIHGECGGYMVLGAGVEDSDGHRHAMLGLLGLETSFAQRKLHLGYRRAQLFTGEGGHGPLLYGHEFHYASVLDNPDPPLAQIEDARGQTVADTGARRGAVTGAFFHLIDREADQAA